MGTISGLINRAYEETGYIEKASNSNLDSETANKGTANYTKYSRDVNNAGLAGCQGQSWCATFQFWLEMMEFGVEQALKNWHMSRGSYTGYNCFSTYDQFAKSGKVSKSPQIGALVIFKHSHMGRVTKISGNTFWTVEGNTGAASKERNGGMVMEKSYRVDDSDIKGFCIIDYPANTASPTPSVINRNVAQGQQWLNDNYGNVIKSYCGELLEVDNSEGPKTKRAEITVFKDVVNRKFNQHLTLGNFNFFGTCKDAAKHAVIRKGADGTLVYLVELILSAKGYYAGNMDAQFGSGLENAVKAFQAGKHLTADGIVGPDTWYALFNS